MCGRSVAVGLLTESMAVVSIGSWAIGLLALALAAASAVAAVVSEPFPTLSALSSFFVIAVLLLDAGAGHDIIYRLQRLFMKPFQMRSQYQAAKTKAGRCP